MEEGRKEGVIPLRATYYKSPFEESSRHSVGVKRADSMICGENVGVVAPQVRSLVSRRSRWMGKLSSSQSAPPSSSPPPLCCLVTHIDTSNFRRFPAREVCRGGCIKEKRSLVSFGCCANLNKGLSVPLRPCRRPPPPPLCSLIKLSPFKSVTVRPCVRL